MQKLIILDRDGVINHDSDQYIKHPDEWVAIEGALHAISRLHHAGYKVIVATNQSGVGRGLFDMQTLNAIHQKMHQQVHAVGGHIDSIFLCPHTPEDRCTCRKPQAGMLIEIAARYQCDLTHVPLVGDSLRDLQAGIIVGCTPYLVRTGKGNITATSDQLPANTLIFDDLVAVVDALLK
jgi:D-glycero-D-manno-heptose 1,7-bisphosphate phosphatase